MVATSATMLLLLGSAAADAQRQTGNLYGTVVDNQGEALPDVTVPLSGAPQVRVTDPRGTSTPNREGFEIVEYPNIRIAIGRNTSVEVSLSSSD